MKLNLNTNKINLFQLSEQKPHGIQKQIKESGYLPDSAPVQVDISSEAIQRYRNSIQQNTPKDEAENYHTLNLTNYSMDLSMRINEINDQKGTHTVKDWANSLLEAYASVYADIVEGYQNGTRCMYDETAEDRILTQEEDLANLNKTYENFAKFFEKQYVQTLETDQMLEKSLRRSNYQEVSDRARKRAESYLREIEARKEERKHVPTDLSTHIIDAGKSFLSKVSVLGNMDRSSIMNLLSSIKMW